MEKADANQELIEAFELMWGNYPGPVMLLNRQHVIVAVSDAAARLGIKPGGNCFALAGNTKICAGCKAPAALKKEESQRSVEFHNGFKRVIDSYWVPVKGSNEFYVHFGNDLTDYADPEKFPQIK